MSDSDCSVYAEFWVLCLKLLCRLDVHRQASSSLQAAKLSCRHLHEASQLATRQRFAHEYDDAETEKHWYARRTALGTAFAFTAKLCEFPEMQAAGKSFVPNRGRNRVNYSTFDQNSAESCVQDRLQPALSLGYGGGAQAALKKGETIPTNADIPPVTNHQDQALRRCFTEPPSHPHYLIKSRWWRSENAALKVSKVSQR